MFVEKHFYTYLFTSINNYINANVLFMGNFKFHKTVMRCIMLNLKFYHRSHRDLNFV